jgi:hypothetical protein
MQNATNLFNEFKKEHFLPRYMTYLYAIRAAFPSYSKQEAVVMFSRILIY